MFGFGKSIERFRGEVDTKLNNEYQIVTDSRLNDKFSGPLKYMEMIDIYKGYGWNENEVAMGIAVTYYCGLLKAGYLDMASDLYKTLERVVLFGLNKGMIAQKRWDACVQIIAREKAKLT